MKPREIRLVIGHDHKLFREGLVELLRDERDLTLLGQATTGREVLDAVESLRPDVLLLDPFMEDMNWLEALPRIRERSPATKVLLLVGDVDRELIDRALQEGARGYLSRTASAAELVKAIRGVHGGEAWVGRAAMGDLLEGLASFGGGDASGGPLESPCPLSEREREVASLVAVGLRNKDIARRLAVSEKTVKSHLIRIFGKLQIGRRLQLALYARTAGTGRPPTAPLHQALIHPFRILGSRSSLLVCCAGLVSGAI